MLNDDEKIATMRVCAFYDVIIYIIDTIQCTNSQQLLQIEIILYGISSDAKNKLERSLINKEKLRCCLHIELMLTSFFLPDKKPS